MLVSGYDMFGKTRKKISIEGVQSGIALDIRIVCCIPGHVLGQRQFV